jgi:MoxR-like ATPase
LPEAQADRFLLKIKADYPTFEEESEIINRFTSAMAEKKLRIVLTKDNIFELQSLTKQVPIAKDLKDRILRLVTATRMQKDLIEYGASPRASIALVLACKARALINGRNHVSADDIKEMAYPVLRHRIILNFEAERKGMTPDDAITQLLQNVK